MQLDVDICAQRVPCPVELLYQCTICLFVARDRIVSIVAACCRSSFAFRLKKRFAVDRFLKHSVYFAYISVYVK